MAGNWLQGLLEDLLKDLLYESDMQEDQLLCILLS